VTLPNGTVLFRGSRARATESGLQRIWDDVHTNSTFPGKSATFEILTSVSRRGKMVLSSLLFPSKYYFQGVVAVSSWSTSRTTPINSAKDTGHPDGATSRGSILPTPQTVSYDWKKRPRTDAVPYLHTPASHSEVQSGPAIPSHLPQPPLTPSRTKTMPNLIARAYRTTPQSQRIVPSSQWSIDEQVPDSSMEANAPDSDPFLLHHPQELDFDTHELTLLPLATPDIPSRSPTIPSLTPVKSGACALTKTRPPSLSNSPRSVPLSSSGYGPPHRSQSSQIVPTSQFDEIELKAPSGYITVSPMRSLRLDHCEPASSIKRYGHLFAAPSGLSLVNDLYHLGLILDLWRTEIRILKL
jgi:hypothetical protein